jgi:hypothetical protein
MIWKSKKIFETLYLKNRSFVLLSKQILNLLAMQYALKENLSELLPPPVQ